MEKKKETNFGWEDLHFDHSALRKLSVSPGQFIISVSGILECHSGDIDRHLNWQIESIDIETCTFFREVTWIADCVRSALREKKGVITVGQSAMQAARISIRDHWGNLVFAAKFKPQDEQVDWISPCRNTQEEKSVAESVGKILAEAKFEREWNNSSVAKELDIYAHLLAAKLTHPKWREPMLSLLSLKRKFS
jgi:hypothetical protein